VINPSTAIFNKPFKKEITGSTTHPSPPQYSELYKKKLSICVNGIVGGVGVAVGAWTGSINSTDRWWALISAVKNLWVPYSAGNFLTK